MSHRGSNLAEGIRLTTISASGVKTTLHFAGDTVVFDREQDMEPILEHVRQQRQLNEGKRWGEVRYVGHIPDLFFAKIRTIADTEQRRKQIKAFFQKYPAFCAYPAYLKG